MRGWILIAGLALSACATGSDMESGLQALVGQPVEMAIDRLGPPAEKTQLGQDTFYRWGRNASRGRANVAPHWPDVTESGAIDFPDEHSTGWARAEYSCEVTIVAGPDGQIKAWQLKDRTGGCRDYARTLEQLASARPQ
jgi:hypothetical protein